MIDDILISHFEEKGSVIIPKKGVFIRTNNGEVGATAFIYNPDIDYSEILVYIKDKLGVDDIEATTIIEGYTTFMDSRLKNIGHYTIKEIGTLARDINWGIYMVSGAKEAVTPPVPTSTPPPATPPKPLAQEKKSEPAETIQASTAIDELLLSRSGTRKLDSIFSESTHKKVEVEAPTTFADKYIKEKDEDCEKESELERHEKLNEIFVSKRTRNDIFVEQCDDKSTAEKVDDMYKQRMKNLYSEESATIVERCPSPATAEIIRETTTIKMETRKKMPTIYIFFIIALALFIIVTGYYLYTKFTGSGELKLPRANTEQIDPNTEE